MAVRTAKRQSKERTRPRHEMLGLTLDDVKLMYRQMLLMRVIGERMMQLNRMGRAPFTAASDGHEAAEVGAGWAIHRGSDWCVPYYRDIGVAIALGFTTLDEFRGVFAKATDPSSGGRQMLHQFSSPRDRILTGSVCIATQFPHAVGLALAARVKKEDHIVFAFGGEAATSPGDFHEAVNFAAVHRLPVVFVIENNLLAISTRFEQQMAVPNVADRAAAYGIPGTIADGMDVLDSYEKVRAAADRARAGGGPSLVELKCYRYLPHTSDDDDSRYRSKDELAYWRGRDPVDAGKAYLVTQGVADGWFRSTREDVGTEIESAIEQAESEPDPSPEDAMRHVYAEDPPPGTRA
ncbi:MAG: thiamine pyrophosphate-dependent dehydrogenase E1 component subunit alpha [Actinobacteria bacterium]|nr:thiamine pyrophosphate-dependent dehydrogenase E1 component subunit alpha [Actinomycetota bacterium]